MRLSILGSREFLGVLAYQLVCGVGDMRGAGVKSLSSLASVSSSAQLIYLCWVEVGSAGEEWFPQLT